MDERFSGVIAGLRALPIEEFLTIEHVSRAIKVNRRYARHLVTSGQLPGIKFGKFWRVHAWMLADFIETNARRRS